MTHLKRSSLPLIAARDTGVSFPQAVVVTDAVLAGIEAALVSGQEVHIQGFGRFFFRTIKAETVVNRHDGTSHWREAYRRIVFKPALRIARTLRQRDLDDADL